MFSKYSVPAGKVISGKYACLMHININECLYKMVDVLEDHDMSLPCIDVTQINKEATWWLQ